MHVAISNIECLKKCYFCFTSSTFLETNLYLFFCVEKKTLKNFHWQRTTWALGHGEKGV